MTQPISVQAQSGSQCPDAQPVAKGLGQCPVGMEARAGSCCVLCLALHKIRDRSSVSRISSLTLPRWLLPGTRPHPGGASESSENQMAPRKTTGDRQGPTALPTRPGHRKGPGSVMASQLSPSGQLPKEPAPLPDSRERGRPPRSSPGRRGRAAPAPPKPGPFATREGGR